MQSSNRIFVESAGSGKTTTLVDLALKNKHTNSAIVTYTINNHAEISNKIYEQNKSVPQNLYTNTWFSFLLRHFVRPYQNHLHARRVSCVNFVNGRSVPYIAETDIRRHYFSSDNRIYTDKISKFAVRIIEKTGGLPIKRFENIFSHLYIDECQDLAGYDLELVRILLESKTCVTLAGDIRQATYSTNNSAKNIGYAKANIIQKYMEWEKKNLCAIEYHNRSHRCIQAICDIADQIYPDLPDTTSLNTRSTEHDGVFAIRTADVGKYILRFRPQILRYSRATKNAGETAINFGNAKGMTFERVLIYPHGPLKKMLTNADINAINKDPAKIYVGITRAKQSVAFVVDDEVKFEGITRFNP